MKLYFVLLAVLYASSVFQRGLVLAMKPPAPLAVAALLDIILFGLCLAGAYELGYGKRLIKAMTVKGWSLVYQATLALGVIGVVYKGYAGSQAAGDGGGPGIIALALSLLSYVLFAMPVVMLTYERKKAA